MPILKFAAKHQWCRSLCCFSCICMNLLCSYMWTSFNFPFQNCFLRFMRGRVRAGWGPSWCEISGKCCSLKSWWFDDVQEAENDYMTVVLSRPSWQKWCAGKLRRWSQKRRSPLTTREDLEAWLLQWVLFLFLALFFFAVQWVDIIK